MIRGLASCRKTLWIILVAGCAGHPAPPTLYESALPVLSKQAEIDRVWPGFWPAEQAFLIYEPEGDALLYTPVAPPPGYEQVPAGSGIPDRVRELVYRHEGVPRGLVGLFDIDYEVGDTRATAVALDATVSATIETLFHETFHRYQDDHFAQKGSGSDFISPEDITASITAKAEVERRLLVAALEAKEDDSAVELARQYLAVRSVRELEMPENVLDIEESMEQIEGSAHYVGLLAAAAALEQPPEHVISRVRFFLQVPLEELGGGLQERVFRWRLYATGAAIGLMLDRLGVENWHERVEDGESFEGLLAEAVNYGSVSDPALLARAALDRFGYEQLLRRFSESWFKEKAPTIDRIYSSPARVVVTFLPGATHNLQNSFNGTLFALEEKLFLIEANLYTANSEGFFLTARDLDVLNDMREGVQLTFALAALPGIEGMSPESGGTTLRQLLIETEGLRIEIDRPVKVEVAADSIGIEIPALE